MNIGIFSVIHYAQEMALREKKGKREESATRMKG